MQSMDPERIEDVEEIIRKNLSRIIEISYNARTKNYTLPGYLISYRIPNPERKLVSSNNSYIKICSMLNSKRKPLIALSKINIKDIYWIKVLDYLDFHEHDGFPSSDIVEVCLKSKWNESDITGLFTLDDKENTEKSLKKIKKMTDSKYTSFKFGYESNLIVLEKFS